MASSPIFKIYDADGEYQGCMKRPEEAAAVVALLGDDSEIRYGHKHVVWTQGPNGDGDAGESYDDAAALIRSRV